jgi:putative glycosyltransferase (TIGR04372 family)
MKVKNTILYFVRQLAQIHEGGWRVLLFKIRILLNRISIWLSTKLLLSFLFYLVKTLIHRQSAINLRGFGSEFSELVQRRTAYQSNRITILFQEAEKLEADLDLKGALIRYQKAVEIDPLEPQTYFKLANLHYLQGRGPDVVSRNYETGLKLMQEKSITLGLNQFGVKIISWEGWGISIGHTSHFDFLVKLKLLGLLSSEKRVVFLALGSALNPCYLDYWKPYLDIIYLDNQNYRLLSALCSSINEHLTVVQGKNGFIGLYSAWNLAENSWQSENRPPLLKLKEIDRERGLKTLENLSIPRGSWFVALHVRETSEGVLRSGSNADILTYLPAMQAITSRGGYIVRMGHPGMKALPPIPNVIDYANNENKSDWMDVFLWASCRFFIGTSSGPLSVPPTFGRPVLYTNACSIGINPNFSNSLYLPKLFWSKEKNRFFTFQEMLDGPMAWSVSRIYDGVDFDLIDNTPEEIELAVVEMLDNHESPALKRKELSNLQQRFNELRQQYGDTGQATISETFIQKYSDLLRLKKAKKTVPYE